jgi:hypothetical protein
LLASSPFRKALRDKSLSTEEIRMVTIDETGLLGTTSSYPDIPTYESTTPAVTPVAFGPLKSSPTRNPVNGRY